MHLRPRLVAGALALASLLAPASALADSSTPLPLEGFSDIVVDDAHGRVFVSGGHGMANSAIVVLDMDGVIVASVGGMSGAGGMVLDGERLYVARCGWSRIEVVDTETLAVIDAIPAPAIGGTCDLALAGGRLWYGDDLQWGELHSVAPLAPHGHVEHLGARYSGPIFATSPSRPGMLLLGQTGFSPANILRLDVAAAQPRVRASTQHSQSIGFIGGLAASPDGSTVFVAARGGDTRAYDVRSFTESGVYPAAGHGNGVAVSGDGTRVVYATESFHDTDVHLFDVGTGAPSLTRDFGDTSDLAYPASVAFSADAQRVFVVHGGAYSDASATLTVVDGLPPVAMRAAITSTAGTIAAGARATLIATIAPGGTHAVALYGTVNGVRRLLRSATTDARGRVRFDVRPLATTTYSVEYAGDAAHAAATATTAVRVRVLVRGRLAGAKRVSSRGYRLFARGARPTYTVSVTPAHREAPVVVTLQRRVGGSFTTVARWDAVLGARGTVAVPVRLRAAWRGDDLRVRAWFPPDADHLGAASPWMYLRLMG